MSENRRYIRFVSIAGIDRSELPIAGEVWLESIAKSTWADRTILKLSTLFMKYVREPDVAMVRFGYISQAVGIDKRGLDQCLRLMMAYGAVESYDCSGSAVRVALNLSYLQRLRVLEIVSRFRELRKLETAEDMPWRQHYQNWLPKTVPIAANSAEDDGYDSTELAVDNELASG